MSSFKKCLVLFCLALSATALTTPHFSRNANHHRAVAAHVQSPAPVVDQAIAIPAKVSSSGKRKRSLNKRCTARPSSSSSSASSAPSSSAAPINVAPVPSIASPSSAAPAPSSTPVAQPTSSPAPAPQPTTSTPAPAPTTTEAPPPPPPTTTEAPPPPATTATPTTSAAPVQTSAGEPSFLIGTQTGEGTYYATGLGACGITNTDTDYIAAVSHLLFDVFPGYDGVNPNDNPVCNQKVTASYQGKSVTVTITDRCTGCAITDLDFSPSAFTQLAAESVGRIDGMTWVWDSI